jgi:hypothetical protein
LDLVSGQLRVRRGKVHFSMLSARVVEDLSEATREAYGADERDFSAWCQPLDRGGLGLRRLLVFGEAL